MGEHGDQIQTRGSPGSLPFQVHLLNPVRGIIATRGRPNGPMSLLGVHR